MEERIIALTGNPNVGKSTLFNSLTGLKQHTGNWAGKTVSTAVGSCSGKYEYRIYDLPGTYSLKPRSAEEAVAGEFIRSGRSDAAAVVCDAGALQRNMNLLLEMSENCSKLLVIINMMDEAESKGISLDVQTLSKLLGRPVIAISAKDRGSRGAVIAALDSLMDTSQGEKDPPRSVEQRIELGRRLCERVLSRSEDANRRDRRIDRIAAGRFSAFPLMILLLLLLFYISIVAANYPSAWLMEKLFALESLLFNALAAAPLPQGLCGLVCCGAYRTLAWVVSVMLPPMAVFFPLFTLLEDSGYLPRIAYSLDPPFRRCGSCGKQALTVCMGFGCNAAAVVGCRIIDSERERKAAMLTNAFIPCNGRFPALIALISMFICLGGSAFISAAALTGFVLLGAGLSLLHTKLLSRTLLKGSASSFLLELPPYRRPELGQLLVRSFLDRSLYVLGRAAAVSAPAGALLWLLANTELGGLSLLGRICALLEPIGRFAGLDGVILAAFILGLPANEIVLPIMLMIYSGAGSLTELAGLEGAAVLLAANGWDGGRAVCVAVMFLCHPCATTLLTVKKETGERGFAFLAWLIPTVTGYLLCALLSALVG